jgi:hypothetical protein
VTHCFSFSVICQGIEIWNKIRHSSVHEGNMDDIVCVNWTQQSFICTWTKHKCSSVHQTFTCAWAGHRGFHVCMNKTQTLICAWTEHKKYILLCMNRPQMLICTWTEHMKFCAWTGQNYINLCMNRRCPPVHEWNTNVQLHVNETKYIYLCKNGTQKTFICAQREHRRCSSVCKWNTTSAQTSIP